MKIGAFTVELLSEGRFEFFRDGHINRSSRKADKTPSVAGGSASDQYSVTGVNPVLVKTGGQNILLDTGLGWGLDAGSGYRDISNVQTNLEIFGLTPRDITHVILSHLHYDHAAGSSFTNRDSKTQITFPRATCYVHQKEWDYAINKAQREDLPGIGYQLDDFYRLIADNKVTFLQGQRSEIAEGITVLHTGGHTPGHQVVKIESEGNCAYYLGDLVPSAYHLNHYSMRLLDTDPIQAKKRKTQLLRKACEEKAILLFYHSKFGQSGRLSKNKDKQYVLTEISRT